MRSGGLQQRHLEARGEPATGSLLRRSAVLTDQQLHTRRDGGELVVSRQVAFERPQFDAEKGVRGLKQPFTQVSVERSPVGLAANHDEEPLKRLTQPPASMPARTSARPASATTSGSS